MRRAAKADSNQPEIVKALRERRCAVVTHIHQVGKGCPDILVAVPGGYFNLLMEIKSLGGSLTPDEEIFHCAWPGQLDIVFTPEKAIELYDKYLRLTAILKGCCNGQG